MNPTTHLGGDNVKQSFLSTETTQWQCTAHLYTWEERERRLKCFEVTCPRMDRSTNVPIYTPTSPWGKVSGFVTKYKALIIIHPHSRKPCIAGLAFKQNSKELKHQRRRRLRKRHLKNEFAPLQTLSHLFQLVQFVKCWQIFLELNSKTASKFRKRKRKSLFCVHVLDKAWNYAFSRCSRAATAKKKKSAVMHEQSCCFINLNLLLFCPSRCRRRRRCLSSLSISYEVNLSSVTTLLLSVWPLVEAKNGLKVE